MSRVPYPRLLFGAVLFSSFGLVQAQNAPQPSKQALPPAAATPQAAPDKDKAKEPEKPKTIDEVTKDFKKMDGIVTLYRQTKDKKDTVYMEIPESRLDKMMLIQITSASGLGDTSAFVFHGQPISDNAVKFHKLDDTRIQLLQPNLAHRGYTHESEIGIERSFPDTVVGSFDVVANQADRHSMLIDVSDFFKSDVADLSTTVDSPGGGGFALDPAATRIDTVKDFPDNFVVRTVYQLRRKGPAMTGDPKSAPWAVSFNVSDIPVNDGYQPRLADPRVGYFITNFEDLTDASQEFDANVNYIERWNMQKADPSLALSPPKKPIVFWIDNAVPKEYRDAVRRGILAWNPAFEKEGIKDAIQVNQMPDDADWDIADLRYNVVRWTTGMPFAIALFRANPMTGEILNASVNMDAGFAAAGSSQFDNVVNPTGDEPKVPAEVMKKWSPMLCDMEGAGREVQAIGMVAAEVLTPTFTEADKKALIQQYIQATVTHEVGHCMGLRHNFTASTQLSLAQLGDQSVVGQHGVSASVMDYDPLNAGAIGKKGVDYYAQTIGTYDYWAIDYGYRPIKADSPEGELSTLKTIASLGSTPGHLYQSDLSADDIDPYVIRFDLGRNPLDYLEKMSNYGPEIEAKAHTKIKNGDSYYQFTRTWMAGFNAHINNAMAAERFIGGGRLASSYHGDPNEMAGYTPVDGATQRRALTLVNKALFAENSNVIDKRDLAHLTFNPKAAGNEVGARSRTFPLAQTIAMDQRIALGRLFNADTLSRMKANEFRASNPATTLTVAEMFHTLDRSVWSEVDGNRPVTDLRRELQRAYLDNMISMSLGQSGVPNDARDLALDELTSLRHRITLAIPHEKDQYTAPHLRECLVRINRALSAQTTVPIGQ